MGPYPVTHLPSSSSSILSLFLDADLIVQSVLLLLVGMSVICWGIIYQKWKLLRTASQASNEFLNLFWDSKRLDTVYESLEKMEPNPIGHVFKAGYQELAKIKAAGHDQRENASENLTRALRRASSSQVTLLQQHITFLATTGSTAPFIGLLGTVWGILRAFQKLGTATQATIQVVGPDIAHALVATAAGLFAAIPAVMAYNTFQSRIRVLHAGMAHFSDDFLNIIKRHLK